MAEQLLICAENLFNVLQFPSHAPAASSEATGYTIDRLANGRRQTSDRFQPNNTNTDVTLTAGCNLLRSADFCAIDRNSNHKGYRYQLLNSNDSFTSSRTVWDVNTIPTVVGGRPSGSYGCVTDEGAWIKTFTVDAANDWRVTSKAMGSGLKPQITGLWLGRSWQPTEYVLQFPIEDRGYDVTYATAISPFGWVGQGQHAKVRAGTLRIGLPSFADEYGYARQIEQLAMQGFPFWLCWQKDTAPWRTILARIPDGARVSLRVDPSWSTVYRTAEIPFVEEQPL